MCVGGGGGGGRPSSGLPRGLHRNDFFPTTLFVHIQKSNGVANRGPWCEWEGGGGALIKGGARCSSVVRAFAHGAMGRRIVVDPLSYFSFQPVLHDWCNKGRGMCYPVYGIVHIK